MLLGLLGIMLGKLLGIFRLSHNFDFSPGWRPGENLSFITSRFCDQEEDRVTT